MAIAEFDANATVVDADAANAGAVYREVAYGANADAPAARVPEPPVLKPYSNSDDKAGRYRSRPLNPGGGPCRWELTAMSAPAPGPSGYDEARAYHGGPMNPDGGPCCRELDAASVPAPSLNGDGEAGAYHDDLVNPDGGPCVWELEAPSASIPHARPNEYDRADVRHGSPLIPVRGASGWEPEVGAIASPRTAHPLRGPYMSCLIILSPGPAWLDGAAARASRTVRRATGDGR